MRQLSRCDHLLSLLPETDVEKITVVLAKHITQGGTQTEKIFKFFRENIIFTHIKPGLGGHFIFVVIGRGQFPEMTACQQAKLVVVVKYDPAMAGYPEIFEENITGEYIADGQIFDGIAPLDDNFLCLRLVGFIQVNIERRHPAFNIGMIYDDILFINPNRSAGFFF